MVFQLLEAVWRDFRFGLILIRKTPLASALILITFALATGANIATFTFANAVLFRPMAYPNPDSLMWVTEVLHSSTSDEVTITADFLQWQAENTTFSGLGGYNYADRVLTLGDNTREVRTIRATAGLLPLLGVPPAMGRWFTMEEDQPGSDTVAVLTDGVWRDTFGGRNVLGSRIYLDGKPYTIIGIMPRSFRFPSTREVDVITPAAKNAAVELQRGDQMTVLRNVVGRLKPGVTPKEAEANLNFIQSHIKPAASMEKWTFSARVGALHEHLVGYSRAAFVVLLSAVGMLLLIACLNVSSFLMMRAASRQGELAIRVAVGANPWQLFRQSMAESSVLAILGSVGGVLFAFATHRLLNSFVSTTFPPVGDASFEGRAMIFTLLLACAVVLAQGLLPALGAAFHDTRGNLTQSAGSVSPGRQRKLMLAAVVAMQFAIAVILVTSAWMALFSFWTMRYAGLGFDPSGILVATVKKTGQSVVSPIAQRSIVFEGVLDRLRRDKGISAAAVSDSDSLPPGEAAETNSFFIEGRPMPRALFEKPRAKQHTVSPDYFRLFSIPLVEGRVFQPSDGIPGTLVAVVNKTLARDYFGHGSAVGQRIRFTADDPSKTIVGVVGDSKNTGLRSAVDPEIYVPLEQANNPDALVILAKYSTSAGETAVAIRRVVREVDPSEAVIQIETFDTRLAAIVAQPRATMIVLGILAILAAGLAAFGVYTVLAYAVRQDARNLAIRMAIGADQPALMWMVVRRGLMLASSGVVVGAMLSGIVIQSARSLLFELKAADTLTIVLISSALILIAAIASSTAAIRILRMNIPVLLRSE